VAEVDLFVLREYQGGIRTTESKAVGQGPLHGQVTSRVRNIIQIAIGIGGSIVDRWRDDSVANAQQAGDGFDASGRRDQMPHHALDARDRRLVRRIPKRLPNGRRFDFVVNFSAGAVGVDVLHVFGIQFRVAQGHVRGRTRGGGRPPCSMSREPGRGTRGVEDF